MRVDATGEWDPGNLKIVGAVQDGLPLPSAFEHIPPLSILGGIWVGDWDGDGVDTPAIHRVNEFHLKNDFTGGPADRVVRVGEDEGPAFGVRLPGRTSDSIVTLFVPGLGA